MSIGSNLAFHHASGIEEKVTLLSRPDSYHALIGARIAVWHLKEPDTRDPQQWINRANHYLCLASYLDKFDN